jgi:acyl-CoA hydrolase
VLRIVVAWLAAVAVTTAVVALTKIGPTLVDFAGPHGVHLGDLVALAASVAVAGRRTILTLPHEVIRVT